MNELTDEKQREVREAFELFDQDKDNLLNLEETDAVLKCLGYNFEKTYMKEIMREYGIVKHSENSTEKHFCLKALLNFLNKRNLEVDTEEELMESFRSFDKDCDGKLNHRELKYLLLSLGEQLDDREIEEMIKEIDTTGEGVIYYEDFVRILVYK